MSVFSEVLTRLVETKHIRILPLAEHCDLERSTIYKFMNGKRDPGSAELVGKLAHYMQLSPAETEELFRAWQIVRVGEDTYYTRKSVEKFFLEFPSYRTAQPELLPSLKAEVVLPHGARCTALTTSQSIDYCVHQMLLSEFQKEDGVVEMILQPDYAFLFTLLATLHPTGTIQVWNIFCVDDVTQIRQNHEVGSLTYLRMMVPLYMNGLDYTPLYFYSNIDEHYSNLNLLPCMVLTQDAALLFSAERDSGIYLQEASVVRELHARFQKDRERCTPFLRTSKLTLDNCAETVGMIFSTEARKNVFTIVPEGCLAPFVTESIVEESLNRDLPDPDVARRAMFANVHFNQVSITQGWWKVYFTEEGITHFVETGRIEELPTAFYHPISVKNRIRILQTCVLHCRKGTYRMLKHPLSHLSQNLHLAIWGEKRLTATLIFNPNQGSMLYLFIQEEGQLRAFQYYLTHIEEDVLYTPEETVEKLEALIRQLRDSDATAQ